MQVALWALFWKTPLSITAPLPPLPALFFRLRFSITLYQLLSDFGFSLAAFSGILPSLFQSWFLYRFDSHF